MSVRDGMRSVHRDVAEQIVVAGAYALAGRLALLMAISPGYASPVWPAAGVALVAILRRGYRVAPAVAAGSFIVNAGPSLESLVIAGCISIGASLQAVCGGALVRWLVRDPERLVDETDIVRFTALAGPVAGTVGATIGNATLWIGGVTPGPEVLFSWWTWWVGDTIGVIIFAPLLLSFVGAPADTWRPRRLSVVIPLVVGFGIVTAAFLRTASWERERLRSELDRRTSALSHAIEQQLGRHVEIVASIASLFESSRDVEPSGFRAFVREPLQRFPALVGLGWNPRVIAADRSAFEANARARGLSGFSIREMQGDVLVPASMRPEYFPAYYLEPSGVNDLVVGYDPGSEPERAATLARARRDDSIAVTPPITLVQGVRGVLLFMPAYGPSAGARADGQLLGFAVGVLRPQQIVDAVVAALHPDDREHLELAVVDASAGGRVLAGSSVVPRASRMLGIGDRRWRVDVNLRADPRRSWQVWIVLAGGLGLLAIIGTVLLVVTGRAARVAAAERTLRASEEQLRVLGRELEARVADRTRELVAAVAEREVLLREVHHRVKNNLQVISSLLSLQARTLRDPRITAAFADNQARIQAIALVHERLYGSKELVRVAVGEYARTLCGALFQAHDAARRGIAAEVDCEDIQLSVDTAIPLGLIVNELVTNSLKYAFPGRRSGTVAVKVRRVDEGVELRVSDDGIGLPADLDPRHTNTLGLDLVFMFAEQVRAHVDVERGEGVAFVLRIPLTSRQ